MIIPINSSIWFIIPLLSHYSSKSSILVAFSIVMFHNSEAIWLVDSFYSPLPHESSWPMRVGSVGPAAVGSAGRETISLHAGLPNVAAISHISHIYVGYMG
jgi:hypothetical protein